MIIVVNLLFYIKETFIGNSIEDIYAMRYGFNITCIL